MQKNSVGKNRIGNQAAAIAIVLFATVAVAVVSGDVRGQDAPPPPPPEETPAPPATPPPTSPPQPPVEAPPPAPPADLPEAKLILDESLEALGGKDKAKELTSFATKAQVNDPLRGELLLSVKSTPTSAFYLVQRIANEPESEMTVAFDGKTGWIRHPTGEYEIIAQPVLTQGQREFDMLFPYWLIYHPHENFKSAHTVDRTLFNETDCYKVRLIKEGDEQFERFGYFAVEKKLIQGISIVQQTPMGAVTLNFILGDWKDIDGRQAFGKVTVTREGESNVEVRYSEIEFNKVDPAILEQPEEVEALVKAREEAAAAPPAAPDSPPPGDAPPTQPPTPPPPAPQPVPPPEPKEPEISRS